ncbi:MAG: single-stranded DNA-binding protein [Verrucomicrobiota bacterium]
MSSYNRVTLLGNITRDPDLKRVKSGQAVVDLGLALNRTWSNEAGERQEETTFVDVTVWGKTAENAAKYLQKGRSVLVEGRLQLDTWTDSNSGQNRSKLRVVAESLQFLGGNQESGQGVQAQSSGRAAA